jgi:hypothetical protein
MEDLLNVSMDKVRLVVDNPRSPMNPVSFQKNKERCDPARDSGSSIKNRWSSIPPPPFLVNSLDCVHPERHSLISSSTTANQKNDKIEIKGSLSMRIPVRLASPVVNNRKQMHHPSSAEVETSKTKITLRLPKGMPFKKKAATSKIMTLRIPVRRASPDVNHRKQLDPPSPTKVAMSKTKMMWSSPVRQASPVDGHRKGLPPLKKGTQAKMFVKRGSPVCDRRKGLPPLSPKHGSGTGINNVMMSTIGIPRPTLIRQPNQKSIHHDEASTDVVPPPPLGSVDSW